MITINSFQTIDVDHLYAAALDSLAVINGTKPPLMSDADWIDVVDRNKKHLQNCLRPLGEALTQLAELRSNLSVVAAERDALATQVAAIEPLKEQIRALKGTPKFQAADLLKQITDAEKEHITKFVANDDRLRPLWAAFLTRVTGAPISIDSQTFLTALAGLKAALGEQRVTDMFTALNIDIVNGRYVDNIAEGPDRGRQKTK